MGRPKKEPIVRTDEEQAEYLAKIGCTNTEIAEWFGFDNQTVTNRFSKDLEKGRSNLKMRLRRAQLKTAIGGNATMQIWLGKNLLGQMDNISKTSTTETQSAEAAKIAKKDKEQILKELDQLRGSLLNS